MSVGKPRRALTRGPLYQIDRRDDYTKEVYELASVLSGQDDRYTAAACRELGRMLLMVSKLWIRYGKIVLQHSRCGLWIGNCFLLSDIQTVDWA
jgi:hypothetical protein